MTPEPPLGMTPNQRIAWDDGVETFHRGLPITADHPYCCAMKDVWEMGWREASEEAGLTPDDYAHWARIGAEDFVAGRPLRTSAPQSFNWGAYVFGYREAGRRAMVSKAAAPTTQQLIDAWVAALDALRKHVQSTLPFGCDVVVDDGRYKGPGKVTYYPGQMPEKVGVTIPSGNEWNYPVTSVRRVE